MEHKGFADFTKQVHLINDLILADMIYVSSDDYAEEASMFKKHLLATKFWFSRVSWANKRRYVLALLHDLKSAWALSVLLKSIWNCRPKDAIYSAVEFRPLCSFDQVPMDHNRTAQPVKTLAHIMKSERKWFDSLDPECQAMVLAELVTSGGAPLMWEVLRRGQVVYERYREHQLSILLECSLSPVPSNPIEHTQVKRRLSQTSPPKSRSIQRSAVAFTSSVVPETEAQRQLTASLAAWEQAINGIKVSQKLEEVEMKFTDGTTRKVWKINRVKPEAVETVDFLQLLPVWIGMRILSFVPAAILPRYTKVNKYWAYLVEELRAEVAARSKINSDLEKLKNLLQKYDKSLEEELMSPRGVVGSTTKVEGANVETSQHPRYEATPSVRPSEKSAYSSKSVYQKLKPVMKTKQKPIRNMAELTERLDRRGAVDDRLWTWCRNVIKHAGGPHTSKVYKCPSRTACAAMCAPHRVKRNISSGALILHHTPKKPAGKRIGLWSRDFSSLYKVSKVASYQLKKEGSESKLH